jgi:hypothetical protein
LRYGFINGVALLFRGIDTSKVIIDGQRRRRIRKAGVNATTNAARKGNGQGKGKNRISKL